MTPRRTPVGHRTLFGERARPSGRVCGGGTGGRTWRDGWMRARPVHSFIQAAPQFWPNPKFCRRVASVFASPQPWHIATFEVQYLLFGVWILGRIETPTQLPSDERRRGNRREEAQDDTACSLLVPGLTNGEALAEFMDFHNSATQVRLNPQLGLVLCIALSYIIHQSHHARWQLFLNFLYASLEKNV